MKSKIDDTPAGVKTIVDGVVKYDYNYRNITNLVLPKVTLERFKKIAKRHGVPVRKLIRAVLEDYTKCQKSD